MPLNKINNIALTRQGRVCLQFTEISILNEQELSQFAQEIIEACASGMHIAFADISAYKRQLNNWAPGSDSATKARPVQTHHPYILSIMPLIEKLRTAGISIKEEKECDFIAQDGSVRPILLISKNSKPKKFNAITLQEITGATTPPSQILLDILQKEFQHLLLQYNQEAAMIDKEHKNQFSASLLEEFTRLKTALEKIPNLDNNQCLENLADTYWRLGMIHSLNGNNAATAITFLRASSEKYQSLSKKDASNAQRFNNYTYDIEDDIRVISEVFQSLEAEKESGSVEFGESIATNNAITPPGEQKSDESNSNNVSASSKPKSPSRSPAAQYLHSQLLGIISGTALPENIPLLIENFIKQRINPFILTQTSANGFSILDDIIHIGADSVRNKNLDINTVLTLFDRIVGLLNHEQKIILIRNVNHRKFSLLHTAALSGNQYIFQRVMDFYLAEIGPLETFKLLANANDNGCNPLHYAQSYFSNGHARLIINSIKNLYYETKDIETLRKIFTQRSVCSYGTGFLPTSFNHKRAQENNLSQSQIAELKKIMRDAWDWFETESNIANRANQSNNNNNNNNNISYDRLRSRDYPSETAETAETDRNRDRDRADSYSNHTMLHYRDSSNADSRRTPMSHNSGSASNHTTTTFQKYT